jgi:hypothetical protein
MRAIVFCIALGCVFSRFAAGGGPAGVPPRPTASDYPVHYDTKTATIAAGIVPLNQAGKMFSPEIAKQYLIVEVAIYPGSGETIDLKPLLFTLKIGGRFRNAEQPTDVAAWLGNPKSPDGPASVGGKSTAVTGEAGVVYGRTIGAANGRSSQSLEAYGGVAVTDGPPAPPTPSQPGPDPRVIADTVWNKALPEGQTSPSVAGYLYFPRYAKKRKSDTLELSYADNGFSAVLLFPR